MSRRSDVINAVLGAAIFVGAIVFVVVQGRTGGKGDGDGTREPDAASEVVDEHMRFRLRAPDRSWRVFGRADAELDDTDSYAMMLDGHTHVTVDIARIGDMSHDQAVAQVVAWVPVEAQLSTVRWLDRDVGELSYDIDGVARRERVFVRDGWLHRIVVSRYTKRELSPDAYTGLYAAFSLLDGPVRPRSDEAIVHDVRGVDWRVVGDRWESAAAGLAIAPPPGWRIYAGHALHRIRRDVDVLVSNSAIGCHVAITAATTSIEADPAAVVMTVEVAGEPRRFVDTDPATPVLGYWATTIERAGGVVRIDGWCPRADGEASLVELRRALAAITAIPDADLAALSTSLAADPFTRTELGAECVYRGGTFAHAGAGLVWKRPPNTSWRVVPCDRATGWLEDAILAVEMPGVSMVVVPDATVLDGGLDRWVGENLPTRTRRVDLSGVNPALGPGLEAAWKGTSQFVHRVVPLVDESKFRVHVYGTGERLEALDEQVRAALATLEPRGIETPVERGNTFVDLRAGYSIELPGWARTDNIVAAANVDRTWRAGNNFIGVTAFVGRDHPVNRARMLRRASPTKPPPPPTESNVSVDGRPGTRLDWRNGVLHVTLVLVERDDVLIAIWAHGDATSTGTALRAFHFVDQPY